jgi:hypothetical protein
VGFDGTKDGLNSTEGGLDGFVESLNAIVARLDSAQEGLNGAHEGSDGIVEGDPRPFSLCRVYAGPGCLDAALSEPGRRGGDTREHREVFMNELIIIAVFALCLLATFGLVRVCEWLRPIEPTRAGHDATSSRMEARP